MLIDCVADHDGRQLADTRIDDIDPWTRKPGCFVWVALRDANNDGLRQMQPESDLHELAVENVRQLKRPYGDPIALAAIASAASILFWCFRQAGWRQR